jgi:hypothetical protein
MIDREFVDALQNQLLMVLDSFSKIGVSDETIREAVDYYMKVLEAAKEEDDDTTES